MLATQTFPKQRRLRKRKEFVYTQTQGRRVRAGCLLGLITHNSLGFCRLGLTVSKKVGNAVLRNQIRRRLRELFRKNLKVKAFPVDLVIVAFPGTSTALLGEAFSRLVRKMRVSA